MTRSTLTIAGTTIVFWAGCGTSQRPASNNQDNNPPQQNAPQSECDGDFDCDDQLFCNGEEFCSNGECRDGSRPCGNLACNEGANHCEAPSESECNRDSDCDDGRFCNGEEFCSNGECRDGDFPCDDMCSEADNECVAENPSENDNTNPDPPSSGPLPEGTFLGTRECDTFYEVGGTFDQSHFSASVALSVSDAGQIVFDGEPLEDGASFTSGTGSVISTYEITSFDETSNGVSIAGNYYEFWNCGNSCSGFTRDGICDEIGFCALGTDCADCGPLEMIGQFSITFRRSGQAIEYTSSITAADPQDFVSASIHCDAQLD